MKKTILFFALLTVSITAFSQVKVRPGVRLGLNAASVTNVDNSDLKIAPNAGLFVNLHLTDFYELQVETNYSNQGAKASYTETYYFNGSPVLYDVEEDLSIHYVSLAIANKFFVIPDVGLHLIIGPSLDINVADDDANVTDIDFSLFGGIGYEFPFGLGIEARYKQGFIDLDESYNDDYDYDDDYDYYDGDNFLNSVFQLGVYYKFNF